ncbi:alkaline phosphatase PhoX [Deinococcus sp.]|uniref:alkaline phosphatase PhoX n=1 Tax=Deinococcus sp. TaxID=47478 RepID=UPI0025BF0777|nr:alkaline phosphatase PhoX [Deinococcus sp.]
MKPSLFLPGLALTLGVTSCAPTMSAQNRAVKSVVFSNTPAPQSDEEMLSTYTKSVATVTYADGSTKDFPLTYDVLFKNTDQINTVNGKTYQAGQLFDAKMNPIMDKNGDPVVAETADGTSLLNVGGKPYLVNHWEYDNILANGQEAYKVEGWYSRMPMEMSLSSLKQGADGKFSVERQTSVDFSSVGGGWIFCAGGTTPWNTHLGGEEDYDLYFVPGEKAYKTTEAGLKAMNEVYFKGEKRANPYDYGYPIEVAVKPDGGYDVTKHYEMGRGTWEIARFANDGRTAVYGDDGAYSGIFMFVGDKQNDPKAGGNLYAAKWQQTSDQNGGAANISWVRLGHSTYAEIKALRDKGLTLGDIFEYSLEAKEGFKPTRAGSAQTIWLKLKPGMEQAAAFLETRRYAAYLGATTEFTKGEGVTFNDADKKMYYAMSYVQTSMKAEKDVPADDVQLPENKAGATYTFELSGGQKDTSGNPINSTYVATRTYVEPGLLGHMLDKADAQGNTADVNAIANTDNLYYSEAMKTLFIGEDSGNHVNNYLWAYNVSTKKLSRIMTLAAGSESTGLNVVESMGNYAYITSNNQHQGDWLASQPKEQIDRLEALAKTKWGANKYGVLNYKLQNSVGYLRGLPAVR